MNGALAQVKRELGGDAVILHTRKVKRGGVWGIGGKEIVEITASADVNVKPRKPTRPAPRHDEPIGAGPTPAVQRLLARAYGAAKVEQPSPDRVAPAPPATDGQFADELRELKAMVQRIVQTTRRDGEPDLPDNLIEHYRTLIEAELAEELARDVMASACRRADRADEDELRDMVADEIAKLVAVEDRSVADARPGDGRPRVVALVGPTGVGKTTTIAKLAATFKLKQNLNVALVTIDTYRIAAVDQLKTYADIIGLPLNVVHSPMEMAAAIDRCHGYDVVLIDTAGRSQRDDRRLEELNAFLDAADPHEVHLVLSSTASEAVLTEAAERFAAIRADRVIFTKMDEAVNFGVVLNVIRKVNKRLSYITTGQEVPHDIEPGEPHRIAAMILGQKVNG